MIPFDSLRSDSARAPLASAQVRVWDYGLWGFWKNGDFTRVAEDAELFEFSRAWELALKYAKPGDLLFDPV
jgi:hypothetical protein